jgi:hypothetical protein
MSEQIDHQTGEVYARMPIPIAAAIIKVMKQIRQLGTDERNEHARYNYVSVDKFYSIIGPLMADAGLALLINEAESEVRVSEGEKKTPWLFASYELTFLHESGAMSTLPMSRSLAMPINGPQTYGAAQSYIEKQFLRQVFKIPTGEKDADETAQGEDAPARSASRGNGATRAPQRQQAAPAPSDVAAEAMKRRKEIATHIDTTEDAEFLLRIEEWPPWQAFESVYREAASPEAFKEGMGLLRKKAAKRRERLVGSLEPFGGK